MIKLLLSLITILFLSFQTISFAQVHQLFEKKGEVYFSFTVSDTKSINDLSSVISIDNYSGSTVYAYANEEEFTRFLNYNLPYKILLHPGDAIVEVSSDQQRILAWDVYPTYDGYIQMMNNFQQNYPAICKIIDNGTTPGGRKMLFAKITKDVNIKSPKPQFMYASSMHGDEATGYVLMLRLIDSLLISYGTDARITRLIDSVEIWIQPLSNPDGTYYGGNSTVTGARRYNYNSIDLNRNCPDPAAGPHPDGNAWQPETIALMNLASANNFVLSANFHGGAEVFNYPWDTWSRLAPDNIWYRFLGRQFADTVHKFSPSTYMDDLENGITNGYAWYRITGGRQDYMTYFQRGREITIEISNTKLAAASTLPTYWKYLKNSLFNYMENVYYGIKGKVTDVLGNPVKANISVQGLAFDNGDIKSDSITGMYYRMISPGTYTVTFSADSFVTQTITGVTASNFNAAYLNIQLQRITPTTFPLSVDVIDGWNMVSIPGLHPIDQNVNTWWSGRNILADVYKWANNTFTSVTNASPKEGYWLLHTGARTYNTGDEWPSAGIQIAAHTSIPISTGWNIIGVYEYSVPVAALTTTPPVLFTSNFIFGWNGTYFNPVILYPGYSYWVFSTGNGVINIPLQKGISAVKDTQDKEAWGKIIK